MARRRLRTAAALAALTIGGALVPAQSQAQRAPDPGIERTVRTVVGATTTVTYVAFIPPSRVDAPTLGGFALCTYGKGYQFGGDSHSSFDWTSPYYRVALNAVIDWKAEKVTGYKDVHPTTVYKKSTGRMVAQKTATSRNMSAMAAGWGTRAGSRYVDVRMVVQATNPFCHLPLKGAINAALTIRLYKNGWWEIRSGTYRRMPNTYVYIYNRGHVTDVVKGKYVNPLCLIGSGGTWNCEAVNLTGYLGDFS